MYFSVQDKEVTDYIYDLVSRSNSLKKRKLQLLCDKKLYQLLTLYYTQPYSLRKIAQILGVSRMAVWRTIRWITNEMQGGAV